MTVPVGRNDTQQPWGTSSKARLEARGLSSRSPAGWRFWAMIEVDANGCWIWHGNRDTGGYGHFFVDYKNLYAHRYAYEQQVGPIPEGLTIDHLCRVTACVNPAHLEAVTMRENTLRGNGVPAQNARKTHCKRGHPLSGRNLHINIRGHRACRECIRLRTVRRALEREASRG